jgi:hypothetical protein
MTAMRRLQDIVVSANPDDALWDDAAGQIEELCVRLEVHRAPEGVAPAGRGPHLPGLGHPLMPLFYDWHFGMIVSAAGRANSRTAYLHVDYRKITPIDAPLQCHGRIDSIDDRKAFVTATVTESAGDVLSEASGLMIRLLPHQP